MKFDENGRLVQLTSDEIEQVQQELADAQAWLAEAQDEASKAQERVFRLRHRLSQLALASLPPGDDAGNPPEFDLFEE